MSHRWNLLVPKKTVACISVILRARSGGKEPDMEKQKHLDIDARSTIQSELDKGSSFKRIAEVLGKDRTTISKEVKKHRVLEQTGSFGRSFNNCLHCFSRSCCERMVCDTCTNKRRPCWSCGKCINYCSRYEPYTCKKLSKAPFVCNGCSDKSRCALEKAFYRAGAAQRGYSMLRSEARSGFAVSEEELKRLNAVVSPLLKRGQSLHHICVNHADELMFSERTLYTYVNNGLLDAINLDMPRTVRMRPRKKKSTAMKVDRKCRIGRTYDDFKTFMENNRDTPFRECDSVEGVKGGKVLLTIHFVQQGLQLAFLRDANDSQSVIDVFAKMYEALTPETFINLFPVLLCDNGSEFSNPSAIEFDKGGKQRTRIFYCNPNAPYEKGSCENNHEMIRRIIPKGTDFALYNQEQISLMMSHINSYARKNLGDKSPYDVFAFQYGEDVLKKLGLRKIPSDKIILSPALLK